MVGNPLTGRGTRFATTISIRQPRGVGRSCFRHSNVCFMSQFRITSYLYSDFSRRRSSDIITDPVVGTPEHEEGLIPGSGDIDEYSDYHPAFEWPGGDESDTSFNNTRYPHPVAVKGQPILRLVVVQSAVLPSKRKVVVLDSYHEAQLGRDVQPAGSVTPRIRLKEMEVSKLHATVYWDGSRKEWNVVDMGSKHGTFLQSGTGSPAPPAIGSRLSPPRSASIPRRLRHGNKLSIGSTTFAVHIHENQRPCQDCSTGSGSVGIPLFPGLQKRTIDVGLGPETAGRMQTPANNMDPKSAMNMLKRTLLKSHDEPKTVIIGTDNYYVDRAARRRMLHVSSYSECPGVPSMSATTDANSRPSSSTPEPTWQRPEPINPSNVGHRLLVQQGWTPGTALGNPTETRSGLIDPLEVRLKQNRAGLGIR
jgi:pSer/pThr/pTyr-binding forkhead associated (FHA) protein